MFNIYPWIARCRPSVGLVGLWSMLSSVPGHTSGPKSALVPLLTLAALMVASPHRVTAQDGDEPQPAHFPPIVIDTDGNRLDVVELATNHHLVLITVRTPDCPVCATQLERVKAILPELEACNVRFLVLLAGPYEGVIALKQSSEFDYPFLADPEMQIVAPLGLAMEWGQLFPGMLEIRPDLTLGWRAMGRNSGHYNDEALLDHFECDPL